MVGVGLQVSFFVCVDYEADTAAGSGSDTSRGHGSATQKKKKIKERTKANGGREEEYRKR